MDWKQVIELLTLIVLTLTLVEIARTRRIDAQQKDLQLLPAMMFYIRGADDDEHLFLRNIGFGAATDVKVLPASFKVRTDKFEFHFDMSRAKTTTFRPEEEFEIGITRLLNDGPDPNSHHYARNFMAYYNPANLEMVNAAGEAGQVHDIETPSQRELTVQFRDITGQKYETILLFSEDGISVTKAPKRIK